MKGSEKNSRPNNLTLFFMAAPSATLDGTISITFKVFMSKVALGAALITLSAACSLKYASPTRQTHLLTLKAKAKIQSNSTEGVLRGVVFLKRPDSIRIDLLGPLNQTVTTIAGSGSECGYYYAGNITPCAIEPLGKSYPSDPKEFVEVLTGETELSSRTGWGFVLDDGRDIVKAFKSDDSVTIELSDYRRVNGVNIPFSIVIKNGADVISIQYNSVELNLPFADDIFKINPSSANDSL